jgi:hypothetical protein
MGGVGTDVVRLPPCGFGRAGRLTTRRDPANFFSMKPLLRKVLGPGRGPHKNASSCSVESPSKSSFHASSFLALPLKELLKELLATALFLAVWMMTAIANLSFQLSCGYSETIYHTSAHAENVFLKIVVVSWPIAKIAYHGPKDQGTQDVKSLTSLSLALAFSIHNKHKHFL